jgi:hypothetical protein
VTLEEVLGFASTKEGADASKGISDWLIVFLCSIVNSCLVKMECFETSRDISSHTMQADRYALFEGMLIILLSDRSSSISLVVFEPFFFLQK